MPAKKKAGTPLLKVGLGGGAPKPGPANPYLRAAVTSQKLPLGNAPQGRPPSNLGRYLIRPTPESDTGFEMLNSTPDVIEQVNKKFLQMRQLPPGLAPTRLTDPMYTKRPEVLETNRAKKISTGFRKPRSLQG